MVIGSRYFSWHDSIACGNRIANTGRSTALRAVVHPAAGRHSLERESRHGYPLVSGRGRRPRFWPGRIPSHQALQAAENTPLSSLPRRIQTVQTMKGVYKRLLRSGASCGVRTLCPERQLYELD